MFPVDCLPEMSLQGCPVILPISQTLTSHMLNARYLTSSYERKDEMNTSYHRLRRTSQTHFNSNRIPKKAIKPPLSLSIK